MALLRVVLDTNVLISGLAYPKSIPGKIVLAFRVGALEVVLSDFILEECRGVLPRLSSRHHLTASEVNDLVDSLAILCEWVECDPTEVEPQLRDVNDQAILQTLKAAQRLGSVDALITGDKDLLELSSAYPILTPAAFWARHGS